MNQNLLKTILDFEDVKQITVDLTVLSVIDYNIAKSSQIILFKKEKSTIFVLTTNNFPEKVKKVVSKLQEKWLKSSFFYCDDESFEYMLSWYDKYNEQESLKQELFLKRRDVTWINAIEEIKQLYNKKNTVWEWEFINDLIRFSYQWWASDLHFQSEEDGIVLRVRKDWVLKKVIQFTHFEFKKYLTKIKFMSWVKLNVDYIPQDWRFSFESNMNWKKKSIDVRVSFMPWVKWENIVMRFLDSSKWIMSFTGIWFFEENLDILQKSLQKKEWMILVTWPTWSWKTTTLYSILNYLNNPWKKIITLEDPIEYQLPWVQQSQINSWKWYTYEEWLKAILRQDPDIIMIWEIRTFETATIAVNAALTWHLVLSTLHTNSSIEAISRLLNMWIESYMLAPSVNLIIWQRLLRKIDDCKSSREVSMAEQEEIKDVVKKINDVQPRRRLKPTNKIFEPVWCENCWFDWYAWRIAAVETLDIDENIRDLIVNWKNIIDIYMEARNQWYLTLKENAYIKMIDWYTTLDEIRRVI